MSDDYRDPYPKYRYQGGQDRYSKALTDDAQAELLVPRRGDDLPGLGGFNTPWGKVHQLTQQAPSLTFVITPVFEQPIPMAIQLRFSLDGITYTPHVPSTYTAARGVEFTLIRSIDPKSGQFQESFELLADDAQPFCSVIARSLTVGARLTTDSPGSYTPLYVQCVVCPVSNIDCDAVSPPVAPVPGFADATIARFAAQTLLPTVILPNPRRALFSISNMSAANLYVALAGTVNITPASEFATVVIPGNVAGGYSVENYRGAIAFQFDADDATGYAVKTEGIYP